MDFKQKYIKYKEKYNLLVNQKNNMKGGEVGFAKGKVRVSIATLNQWSTDYDGNEKRIKQAIKIAIKDGAKLILLPELAVCGYSCQDHFLERETHELSFNVIRNLLKDRELYDILIVIGCPVIHNDVRYNTNFYILNGEILLIRPKILLADDGNYREARWFTPWPINKYEEFKYKDGSEAYQTVPIGIGIINCHGVLIASEICEELWVPNSINSDFYLNGVDIILNSSGSHFETGKLEKRIKLITEATRRSGGIYLYSNLEGGDGDRLFFDGRSIIAVNGQIVNIEDGFTLRDVQVMTEDIDLGSILSYRMRNNSFGTQASKEKRFKVIPVEFDIAKTSYKYNLSGGTNYKNKHKDKRQEISYDQIEEITNAASAYLWDYMRRSGAMGFQLPLSGGADSAATATIIYNICLLMQAAYEKELSDEEDKIPNKNVSDFINKFYILKETGKIPLKKEITPELLCSRILNTVYLPTEISGKEDKSNEVHLPSSIYKRDVKGIPTIPYEVILEDRNEELLEIKRAASHDDTKTGWLAAQLAHRIGATHRVIDIQGMFKAGINGISEFSHLSYEQMKDDVTLGRSGTDRSKWDLLYQNIQARLRMINTYLLAQATPCFDDSPFITPQWSFLLVLGSSNADEILVGYYTKYDASAADINPIGSLSKTYVNKLLQFYGEVKKINPLRYILNATPTAELVKARVVASGEARPPRQTDETDMKITYEQIYEMGKLRLDGYGPIDAYIKIMSNEYLKNIFSKDPNDLKTKRDPKETLNLFYNRYNINRNKTTIIPPSVHLVPSPDDNRYDLRPFLLPKFSGSRQDKAIESMEKKS
jgi:NAD+ synthase (glutamine-hydrolysing)